MREVIVVGGGASGLVAAISAARNGAHVTLLEQKERIGKKILSTGNGRCNLTNTYMDSKCFYGDDTSIVSTVLEQFGTEETTRFFEDLGVVLKERQGYIYPYSDQATTIVDALSLELNTLNVSVVTNTCVIDIQKLDSCFSVTTLNRQYLGDAVILATGGKAAPVLGSDGKGFELAQKLGHHISNVVPALVQLRGVGTYFKQIAGVRTQAKVSLYIEQQLVASDTGELQLTNYGISGIPVFQISRFAAKACANKKNVYAEIDFMPHMEEADFDKFMKNRMVTHREKTAEDFLIGLFNTKIGMLLLKEAKIPAKIKIKDIYDEKLNHFIFLCKHFRIEIAGTNDFEQAQVCAGGVKTSEIHPNTMESIYIKNLYITGEVLDIDGICGGYNLQWAWATGFLAGKNAAKGYMNDKN